MLAAVGLVLAAAGCGDVYTASSGRLREPVVYGDDDRREPFAADEPEWLVDVTRERLLALGSRANVSGLPPALANVPTLQQRYGLCDGEAFADQPSFAACTGVIVSPRWVLTAAHCVRAYPLSELVGLGGFYVENTGKLRVFETSDVHTFTRVVASDEYWDYAWLELATPRDDVETVRFGSVDVGDEIVSPQHGAGLPAKIASSRVAELDAGEFWSTLDAFGGASGAPVFSWAGELAGVLTSGAADYDATPAGCLRVSLRADLPEAAAERAVRVEVALEGLCEDAGDAELCTSLPANAAAGCATGAPSGPGERAALELAGLVLAFCAQRRARHRLEKRRR